MKTPLDTFSATHKSWVDPFIVELRLDNVPGAAIGDALETVHAHCADSGETPHEAFGDPKDYARSLGLAGEPDSTLLPVIITSAGSLAAFFIFSAAFKAWARSEDFAINDVSLVAIVGALVATVAAISTMRWWAEKPLRFSIFAIAVAGFAVLGTFAASMNRPALLSLPSLGVTMVAAVILVGTAVLATARELRSPDTDPLISPFESPEALDRKSRNSRLLMFFGIWMLPLVALLDAAFTLILLS